MQALYLRTHSWINNGMVRGGRGCAPARVATSCSLGEAHRNRSISEGRAISVNPHKPRLPVANLSAPRGVTQLCHRLHARRTGYTVRPRDLFWFHRGCIYCVLYKLVQAHCLWRCREICSLSRAVVSCLPSHCVSSCSCAPVFDYSRVRSAGDTHEAFYLQPWLRIYAAASAAAGSRDAVDFRLRVACSTIYTHTGDHTHCVLYARRQSVCSPIARLVAANVWAWGRHRFPLCSARPRCVCVAAGRALFCFFVFFFSTRELSLLSSLLSCCEKRERGLPVINSYIG